MLAEMGVVARLLLRIIRSAIKSFDKGEDVLMCRQRAVISEEPTAIVLCQLSS